MLRQVLAEFSSHGNSIYNSSIQNIYLYFLLIWLYLQGCISPTWKDVTPDVTVSSVRVQMYL